MIRPQPFQGSSSYQAVVRALLRMHRLTLKGQDESEEADSLRESMNALWEGLSQVERERVTGLSKDLYEISDHPARAPEPTNPQAQRMLNEAYETRERGEWDRALELLRRWGKYHSAPFLSYLRGKIWHAAGDAATAVVFLSTPPSLTQTMREFKLRLLDALETANPREAADRAEAVLQNSAEKNPAVVLHAAIVILGTVREKSDLEAASTYHRLIPIGERALARLEGPDRVPKEMAFLLLATCYREIGDTQRAYGYYSQAIQLDPTNSELLTARGMLMYGTDPNSTADFEQAIRLGSRWAAPYFYLAPLSSQ